MTEARQIADAAKPYDMVVSGRQSLILGAKPAAPLSAKAADEANLFGVGEASMTASEIEKARQMAGGFEIRPSGLEELTPSDSAAFASARECHDDDVSGDSEENKQHGQIAGNAKQEAHGAYLSASSSTSSVELEITKVI